MCRWTVDRELNTRNRRHTHVPGVSVFLEQPIFPFATTNTGNSPSITSVGGFKKENGKPGEAKKGQGTRDQTKEARRRGGRVMLEAGGSR